MVKKTSEGSSYDSLDKEAAQFHKSQKSYPTVDQCKGGEDHRFTESRTIRYPLTLGGTVDKPRTREIKICEVCGTMEKF